MSSPQSAKTGPNPIIVAGVVAVVAVGAAVFFLRPQAAAPAAEIQGLETFPGQIRDHKEGRLTFPQYPPVGGVHNPDWQNAGIYNQPIAIEKAVHTLEHGGVWIAYQPTLDPAEVEALKKLVRGRGCTLLAPYTVGGLDQPIEMMAWGFRLKLEKADDPRVGAFLQRFERGSQTPEPGAACGNATGTPDEQ
jgi:hypothetical protein